MPQVMTLKFQQLTRSRKSLVFGSPGVIPAVCSVWLSTEAPSHLIVRMGAIACVAILLSGDFVTLVPAIAPEVPRWAVDGPAIVGLARAAWAFGACSPSSASPALAVGVLSSLVYLEAPGTPFLVTMGVLPRAD